MVSWFGQYWGQLYRSSLLKVRAPFKIVAEIGLLMVMVFIVSRIKVLTPSQKLGPQTYFDDSRKIPTLDELMELPTIQGGLESTGSWYLEFAFEFELHGAANIAYSCALKEKPREIIQLAEGGTGIVSPGPRLLRELQAQNQDFVDICQTLMIGVAAENDAQSTQLAENFKAFLVSKVAPENRATLANRFQTFANEDAARSYMTSDDYNTASKPPLGVLVIFKDDNTYAIQLNRTSSGNPDFASAAPNLGGLNAGVNSWTNIPDPNAQPIGIDKEGTTRFSSQYLLSGYLTMQKYVEAFLMEEATGGLVSIDFNMFAMPTLETGTDPFWRDTPGILTLFVMLALLLPVAVLSNELLVDKESRFRELMLTMGLSPSAWMFGWLTIHLVIGITSCLAATLMAEASDVFDFSNTILVLVHFVLLSFALTAHTFVVVAFFERASVGMSVTVLTLLFGYLLLSTLDTPFGGLGLKIAVSIFHPIACFGFGTSAFGRLEAQAIGATFDTWNDTSEGNFPVSLSFLIQGFNFFFYILVASYVDSFMPSSSASGRYPWHWPLTHWFKRNVSQMEYSSFVSQQESDENELSNVIPLEGVSGDLKAAREGGRCIMFSNIEKTYDSAKGKVKAVRGVTFSIFENQVTVLLGSNGAGKTTLSSILSGLVDATAGNAFVNGKSITKDMYKIRQKLGVCTQKNIYCGIMSVDEHLRLFASIKGLSGKRLSVRIRAVLDDVGLTKKRHVEAKYLSGGMKRKLQLAIALLDADVCILDEPTSGLDVAARQLVQQTISKYRKNRSIILTTHYMDEADVLGDRIAIMANGKLECCGSSLYLKSRYGVGYQVTVVQKVGAGEKGREDLIDVVSEKIPEMTVVTNAGTEFTFRTPLESSKSFPSLLRELEGSESLQVANTGVAVTNLESVFLRVIDGVAKDNSSADDNQVGFVGPKDGVLQRDSDADAHDEISIESNNWQERISYKETSFVDQVTTLLDKRVLYARRGWRTFLCQMATPIIFLLCGMATMFLGTSPDTPAILIGVGLEEGWETEQFSSPLIPISSNAELFSDALTSQGATLFRVNADASNTTFCRTLTSGEIVRAIEVLNATFPGRIAQFEDLGSVVRGRYNSICQEEDLDQEPFTDTDEIRTIDFIPGLASDNSFKRALAAYSRLLFGIENAYGGFVLNNYTSSQSIVEGEVTLAYNLSARHAAPLMMNRVNSAALSTTLQTETKLFGSVQAFPETVGEQQRRASVNSFTAILSIIIAFSFVPATYSVFVVRERESHAWHQQLVNGVSPFAYWVTNFIFDITTFLVPLASLVIFVLAFDLTTLVEEIVIVILLVIVYALAVIPFTYVLSHAFQTSAFAQFGTLCVHMLGSTVLLMTTFMLGLFGNSLSNSFLLAKVFRILPSYAFGHGLLSLSNIGLITTQVNSPVLGGDPSNPVVLTATSLDIAGYDLLYLAIEAVFFWFVLLFQAKTFRGGMCVLRGWQTYHLPTEDEDGLKLEDDDVKTERAFIDSVSNSELRALTSDESDSGIKAVFKNVRKVYSDGNVAVQDLSFTLRNNECFGLLGTNGAGKTSTQSMLSGEIQPSAGSIYLDGTDVVANPAKAQSRMGYCPQADAIFDLLTAREHLHFYARIKGVPAFEIPLLVDRTLRELALIKYADKLAGSYSGGNKRKLSMAMATLGTPSLVLLDEPSAGIDPTARRMLTIFIEKLAKRTSVVLTTHSMEECEALCNRIGIMVDGGLRCLNSVPNIKAKYGTGYQFEASIKIPSDESVQSRADSFGIESLNLMAVRSVLEESDLYKAFSVSLLHDAMMHGSKMIEATTLAEWAIIEESMLSLHDLLRKKFSKKVKLVERQGRRIRFSIPDQTALKMADMFEIVERERSNVGIDDFSIAQTTLERVFLNFAAGSVQRSKQKVLKKKKKIKNAAELEEAPGNDDIPVATTV